MATALRVVSWNIRAAIGPGPFPDRWWSRIDADRLRAIGAFLSSLGADLIALQEVAVVSRDGDLVDNPGDLARQLGWEARYGAVRWFPVVEHGLVVGTGTFGNALLSRLPMERSHTVALPAAARGALVEPADANHGMAGVAYRDAPESVREPRCLLRATVGGLEVGTAHFSHVGAGERLLQARATVEAFAATGPALLLGDLNAEIGSPELRPFADWIDGFAEPADDEARISTDAGHRIDHLLARRVSVSNCRVLRASADLSDHYPVLAEVRLG